MQYRYNDNQVIKMPQVTMVTCIGITMEIYIHLSTYTKVAIHLNPGKYYITLPTAIEVVDLIPKRFSGYVYLNGIATNVITLGDNCIGKDTDGRVFMFNKDNLVDRIIKHYVYLESNVGYRGD